MVVQIGGVDNHLHEVNIFVFKGHDNVHKKLHYIVKDQ